ncbi:MAG: hypothetical protein R6X33_07975 [Candidatus Brocadiia bacterium]
MRIDAENTHYRELNEQIRAAVQDGATEIVLDKVRGQRYIGAGLGNGVHITVNGVPGNDLGAFMDGAEISVNGNGQDGVANTMNAGRIVIHGGAGDILGYSMRGGQVFVRGDVGYRAGIHMKAYEDRFPILVVGGRAGDYLGEYMAGGVLVVLGMEREGDSYVGEWVGTGMHGGVMYLRGQIEEWRTGAEVGIAELDDADWRQLSDILTDYCTALRIENPGYARKEFHKVYPQTARPYGTLYAY